MEIKSGDRLKKYFYWFERERETLIYSTPRCLPGWFLYGPWQGIEPTALAPQQVADLKVPRILRKYSTYAANMRGLGLTSQRSTDKRRRSAEDQKTDSAPLLPCCVDSQTKTRHFVPVSLKVRTKWQFSFSLLSTVSTRNIIWGKFWSHSFLGLGIARLHI